MRDTTWWLKASQESHCLSSNSDAVTYELCWFVSLFTHLWNQDGNNAFPLRLPRCDNYHQLTFLVLLLPSTQQPEWFFTCLQPLSHQSSVSANKLLERLSVALAFEIDPPSIQATLSHYPSGSWAVLFTRCFQFYLLLGTGHNDTCCSSLLGGTMCLGPRLTHKQQCFLWH